MWNPQGYVDRFLFPADVVVQLFDDLFGLSGVLSFFLDFVAGVHYRRMVALKDFGDIGEGIFQLLTNHIHGHLTRIGDVLGAVL